MQSLLNKNEARGLAIVLTAALVDVWLAYSGPGSIDSLSLLALLGSFGLARALLRWKPSGPAASGGAHGRVSWRRVAWLASVQRATAAQPWRHQNSDRAARSCLGSCVVSAQIWRLVALGLFGAGCCRRAVRSRGAQFRSTAACLHVAIRGKAFLEWRSASSGPMHSRGAGKPARFCGPRRRCICVAA